MYVCVYVCYRFSRQPLTRLIWNFPGIFVMMSERQLNILVPSGCIINDLSHKSCIFKGPQTTLFDVNGLTNVNGLTDVNALVSIRRRNGFTHTPIIWRQVTPEQRKFRLERLQTYAADKRENEDPEQKSPVFNGLLS